MKTLPSKLKPRSGFTLIELLVVVAIIAFLVGISFTVITSMVVRAREEATAGTVVKIHGMLNQRIEAFNRTLKGKQLTNYINRTTARLEAAKIWGMKRKAVEVLVRKDQFRENFPQNFRDNPNFTRRMQTDNRLPTYVDANHTNVTASAELLYYLLTSADVFGVAPVDTDAFSTSEVADTDDDGRMEFVDAWGNPLRFYRWPTRLIKPGGTTINRPVADLLIKGLPEVPPAGERDPLNQDPEDLVGLLQGELNRLSNFSSDFREARFHTIDTYHVPLIVSAGPDGFLGLYEPYYVDADEDGNDLINTLSDGVSEDGNSDGEFDNIFGTLAEPKLTQVDALTDNITNRNRRAGGG